MLGCPEYIVRLMVFAISILYIFKNINRLFQKKNYSQHATLYHLEIEKKIKILLKLVLISLVTILASYFENVRFDSNNNK